ncbi:hypothetical protein ABZS86_07885 [Streptomyces sp. NPDC005355]|uniref:hypothetical protein n=1 Tax=Streptomyces sp. NPDC005355 TaxID=3157038 RepID=UPI0033ABE100
MPSQLVRGMGDQGSLPDAGHAVDRVDGHNLGWVVRGRREESMQLVFSAGEGRNVAGEGVKGSGGCRGGGGRRMDMYTTMDSSCLHARTERSTGDLIAHYARCSLQRSGL